MTSKDETWMQKALELAKKATELEEVPVGAILVKEEKVLAQAFNHRETQQSPLAHAEILALDQASKKMKSWRLIDCTLFVTLEPCLMCWGAILQARIDRVVFGASDPKAGVLGSILDLREETRFNHQAQVSGGVLAEECGSVLSEFFEKLRAQKRTTNLPARQETNN